MLNLHLIFKILYCPRGSYCSLLYSISTLETAYGSEVESSYASVKIMKYSDVKVGYKPRINFMAEKRQENW